MDIAFADETARARSVWILALARPGIGESDRSPASGRRVADWAADVDAACGLLGVERAAALGWSAGGPFALACAAALGGPGGRVVRAATVGGMAPLVDPLSARQLGLKLDRILFPLAPRRPGVASLIVRASALTPARLVHSSLARSLPPEDRAVVAPMAPADVAAWMKEATRRGPHGVVDDYAVLAGDWGFALSDVAVPVTVFQGAADTLLPRSHSEALAAQLPTGRLEVVEGAGHFLLHPQLDRVLDALVD